MTEILSTSDYSNWPDWMIQWRINCLQRNIAIIDKKIQDEEDNYKEYLKKYEKDCIRYEKHKHLLNNLED